uniref:Uncharacterized protein n=1 Tax=Parascaris univalens TaxID=6257 RepID=A0A914ZX14_PARUN
MIITKIKHLSYTKIRNTNNQSTFSSATSTHADDNGEEMKSEEIIKAKASFAHEMKHSLYELRCLFNERIFFSKPSLSPMWETH